jgi:hypothetical protein
MGVPSLPQLLRMRESARQRRITRNDNDVLAQAPSLTAALIEQTDTSGDNLTKVFDSRAAYSSHEVVRIACRPLHQIPICETPCPHQPMGILHVERRGRFFKRKLGCRFGFPQLFPLLSTKRVLVGHAGKFRKAAFRKIIHSADANPHVMSKSGKKRCNKLDRPRFISFGHV